MCMQKKDRSDALDSSKVDSKYADVMEDIG